MPDAELDKVIGTWERIVTDLGPAANMRVIIRATLVQLYALRIMKQQSASAVTDSEKP